MVGICLVLQLDGGHRPTVGMAYTTAVDYEGPPMPPTGLLRSLVGRSRAGLIGELLAERGIEVDHVTVYRWVQRLTPLLADAAHRCVRRPEPPPAPELDDQLRAASALSSPT